MSLYRSHVLICGGTGCTSSGGAKLIEEFEAQLKEAGLENEVKIVKTGCFGLCALGPVVVVYPEGAFYSRVEKDDVKEIVTEHLLKGRIVKRLVYDETLEIEFLYKLRDEQNFGNLDELKAHYERGGLGDMKVKKFLNFIFLKKVL